MQSFTVSDLDELIKQTLSSDKNIGKLLIGYKLFAELMNDSKFSDEVNHSGLSSNKRRYKNLKIKVTTDEYQLCFES